MPSSFKELRVWQKAVSFAVAVYCVTSNFPKDEVYGLSQQLRRAAVSISSIIAEGEQHRSERQFRNALLHARGALLEAQRQLMIAQELQYISPQEGKRLLESSDGIGPLLRWPDQLDGRRKSSLSREANDERPTTNHDV